MLGSVTPLMAFSSYLEKQKRAGFPNGEPDDDDNSRATGHLHLLRYIKMVKIFEEQINSFNEVKAEYDQLVSEVTELQNRSSSLNSDEAP